MKRARIHYTTLVLLKSRRLSSFLLIHLQLYHEWVCGKGKERERLLSTYLCVRRSIGLIERSCVCERVSEWLLTHWIHFTVRMRIRRSCASWKKTKKEQYTHRLSSFALITFFLIHWTGEQNNNVNSPWVSVWFFFCTRLRVCVSVCEIDFIYDFFIVAVAVIECAVQTIQTRFSLFTLDFFGFCFPFWISHSLLICFSLQSFFYILLRSIASAYIFISRAKVNEKKRIWIANFFWLFFKQNNSEMFTFLSFFFLLRFRIVSFIISFWLNEHFLVLWCIGLKISKPSFAILCVL